MDTAKPQSTPDPIALEHQPVSSSTHPRPHLMPLEERPAERLLLDFLPRLTAQRVLSNTVGRGQFASEYARRDQGASVACWLVDLYQTQQIQATGSLPANLHLVCATDPPPDEVDLVAWVFSRDGNGELVRDMLQIGHERLTIGGQLIVAINNPRDKWLHELLQNLFPKVSRYVSDIGILYLATKNAPLKKHKQYAAEFAFRDGERLIYLRTRPSVFSHRELDGGARALIKTMNVQPGMRVLDVGCGCGAVGIAAALRAAEVQVNAIDSNPRAIESTLWAAERNSAANVTATLDCDGRSLAPAVYDLVLANPPYYSNFRIARLFVQIAAKALQPGGTLLLVTKMPQWYTDHLPDAFTEVTTQSIGDYSVLSAERQPALP
ncbi:MAG TPA: methyltransferase [Pirellulaceae bacterium]|jgi:16S rRNA (guanine1207-N2)-methyltransferase